MTDRNSSDFSKRCMDYCENPGSGQNPFEESMASFQDLIRHYQFRIALMNVTDGTPQGDTVAEEPVEQDQEERICSLRRELDKAARVRKDLQRKQDTLQTQLDAIAPNGEGAVEKLNALKVQIEEIVSMQFGMKKKTIVLCLKITQEMQCNTAKVYEIAQNFQRNWIQGQGVSNQVVLDENFDQLRFMQNLEVVEKLSKMALDELCILEEIEEKNMAMLTRCATTTAPESDCRTM